jgi:hypothetical protein
LKPETQKLKTAKALLDMVSLKRFERSKAVERLERLERTDPRFERSKAVERLERRERVPFALERRFQLEKAVPKLLNRAYSALSFPKSMLALVRPGTGDVRAYTGHFLEDTRSMAFPSGS